MGPLVGVFVFDDQPGSGHCEGRPAVYVAPKYPNMGGRDRNWQRFIGIWGRRRLTVGRGFLTEREDAGGSVSNEDSAGDGEDVEEFTDADRDVVLIRTKISVLVMKESLLTNHTAHPDN